MTLQTSDVRIHDQPTRVKADTTQYPGDSPSNNLPSTPPQRPPLGNPTNQTSPRKERNPKKAKTLNGARNTSTTFEEDQRDKSSDEESNIDELESRRRKPLPNHRTQLPFPQMSGTPSSIPPQGPLPSFSSSFPEHHDENSARSQSHNGRPHNPNASMHAGTRDDETPQPADKGEEGAPREEDIRSVNMDDLPPIDFTNMTDLPTHSDENPHLMSSREGDPPPGTENAQLLLYEEIAPLLVAARGVLLDGAEPVNADNFESKLDTAYILPMNSVFDYINKHPDDVDKIMETLNQLDLQKKPIRRVELVTRPNHTKKPKVFGIRDLTTTTRELLDWQHLFPVNKGLGFFVITPERIQRSWVITNLEYAEASDDPDQMNEALAIIKTEALNNRHIARAVTNLTLEAGLCGPTLNHRIAHAMESWHIVPLKLTIDGRRRMIWQLRGKPLVDDDSPNAGIMVAINQAIRAPTNGYILNHAPIKPSKPFKDCSICQSNTHPHEDCPYVKLPRFPGPTGARVDEDSERSKKPQSKGQKKGGKKPAKRDRSNSRDRAGPSSRGKRRF
ncbi:hypothetical protein VNI00_000925 [Paramarasmius palmivorus]|uniref:Uncharacterized protein n=1 Tax=Paramarasmius palmivorus TaxID=297713 RepID=A0AAW0E7P6_9AGAR